MIYTNENFWNRVNKEGPVHPVCGQCWVWTGRPIRSGYGRIRRYGKLILAHRLSWIIHNKSIPKGLLVLHKCDNKMCVNPNHLFLGTHQDNSDDKIRKGRDRKASGVSHGSYLHPERVARGERHGLFLHPEKRARGEVNGNSKLTEETVLYIKGRVKRAMEYPQLLKILVSATVQPIGSLRIVDGSM